MKVKTFILTFLMMMSSPFLFGQHWTDPGNLGYENSMTVYAQVMLDNEVQTDDYQVAAFHGDELLEVSKIIPLQGTTSNYHVHLMIQGDNTTGNIYFKFFDGTKEYVSETEIPFEAFTSIGGHPNYSTINFKSVAQIEGTDFNVVYPSLQKAIDACKEGGNTIELLANNAENVTIKQVEGVNVTIDGGDNRFDYSGTITIHGNARYQGTETLTFTNIDFITNEAGHYFIDSNSTGSVERYAHNVTVSNCNFTATGAGINSAAAMRIRQGFDIAINGGTFTNLHSALQAYGNAGITVSGITLNGKNGISAGTSTGVVIENSNITATGYGLRADGTGAYDMTLRGANTTITAELPVVVRNTTGAYELTVESGTYTALNGNPAVTFTTGDDGTFVAPTSPATATIADGVNVTTFGLEAKIANDYYTIVANAATAASNETGDQTIVLIKDATSTVNPLNVEILDLNAKTLTANVIGKVKTNGGLWITPENFKMIGAGADYYTTNNATIVMGANYALRMTEGTVTLAQSWRTLPGQTVAIESNAKFIVPAGMTYQIYGTAVAAAGTLEVNGTVQLAQSDATLTAPEEGLNVVSGVDDYVVKYDNGVYKLVAGNVLNANTGAKYATLAEAIAVAEAGNTIKLLADITEDVTVNKNVTIDGGDKNYTGQMKMTNRANITVKNVNFDGKGYNGYAIETRGAYYLTVEACTAKNYVYGFVQLASGTVLATVKNVTVSDMNYGVKVDYSNAVVIDNVNIDCAEAAVLNSNYGSKTITIKNSDLSILGTWTRNETIETTYVFEGANSIDEFVIDADIDNFKLADVNSTLTAPNDITVTTDVENSVVVYEGGMYKVQGAIAKIQSTGVIYPSVAAAVAAATADDVIELLANVEENVTINKNVTLDGANFNYTGQITANKVNFTVENVNFVKGNIYKHKSTGVGGNFTIKNCTFDGQGLNSYAVDLGGTSAIVIEGVTAQNYGYGFLQVPASNTSISVKDVTISKVNYGLKVDYSNGVTLEKVNIADEINYYGIYDSNHGSKTYSVKDCNISSIKLWDRNTGKIDTFKFEGANTVATLDDSPYVKYVLAAADATLTAPEGKTVTTTVENSLVKYVDGAYIVVPAVAKIGDVCYETLADAIAAIGAGDVVIELLANVSLDITAWQTLAIGGDNTTSITIDGDNGEEEDFTLTFNKLNSDWNHVATSNDNTTKLILKNLKLADSGYNNGPWNRYDIVFASDVELTNVVSAKALAFKADATLNNVTINESGDNYAIWIQPNGQSVTIDGLVINSAGRGIKVDEQYVTAQNVSLSVANAIFTTAKKAAIMVKSSANTTIAVGENVNIDNVAADQTNIAWVDEDAAAHYGKVTVTGGTLTQENLPVFVAALMNGAKVEGYYKVFEEALAAAESGETITLLNDVTGAGLKINKDVTIDLNDKTYTIGAPPAGSTGTQSQGFQLLKGNEVTIMNGNIAVIGGTHVVWMFNSYANLTLSNLTVDCANMDLTDPQKKYVVVANNGGGATPTVTMTNVTVTGFDEALHGAPYYVDPETALVAKAGLSVETAEDYEVVYNENGSSYTAIPAVNVKIVDANNNDLATYPSFTKAIEAFVEGQTIVVLKDFSEIFEINSEKAITIDLAGKTFNGAIMPSAANLTIKNGTINNTDRNYSAIEITSGSLTLNDVNVASARHAIRIDGAVTANIKGGEYTLIETPNMTQHVLNISGNANVTIEGGTFVGPAGTASDSGSAVNARTGATVIIEGGNFKGGKKNTLSAAGTLTLTGGKYDQDPTAYLAEGYFVKSIEDGDYKYEVYMGVAEILGGAKYESLQSAINAAADGDEIVLLQNITENVTVNKNVTIDGGDKNYTGTMTISNGKIVTVQNVNFVKGCIDKSKGTSGTLTVKDCTFDGVDGSINYAVTMRGGNTVTIEGGDVKNYGYGMLYVPSAVSNVNVKSTTVDGVNYGVHVAYGSKVNIEGVTMTNMAYGIMTQNYGAKTITIKNSSISGTNPILVWERNTTVVDTFNFEGENTVASTNADYTISAQANLVLAATDATLTAPEGLTVTTSVADHIVDYADGKYYLRVPNYVAAIGETKYESLQAAIDAAVDGNEIVVLKDITLEYEDAQDATVKTFFNVNTGKTISIDLNGNNVKAFLEDDETVTAFFYISNSTNLTLKDLSDNNTGTVEIESEAYVSTLLCNDGGYLTVENGNYILEKGRADGSGSGGLVYSGQDEVVTINGGYFHLGNVGTSSNGSPWIFNASGQNTRNIIVNGGTFNADILHQYYPFEVKAPKEKALQNNGDGTWTMVDAVAYVDEQHKSGKYYTNEVGYATLEEAFAAAQTYNQGGNYVTTVTMLANVTAIAPIVVEDDVKFNMNAKAVTAQDIYPVIRIQNGANVTVTGAGSIINNDYVFVLGASDGLSAGNLTIESGMFVGETTVASVTKGLLTINGGEFSVEPYEGNYAYLINCIDENYADETAGVSIKGGKFHNWNPQDNAAEGSGTNFCAEGYAAVETSENVWEVFPAQQQHLVSGWNWYSSYLDITTENLLGALGTNGKSIVQNTTWTADYMDGEWVCDDHTFDVSKMYMIQTSEACELALTGNLVDASEITITLNPGWNWIGYPSNVEVRLEDALSRLEPSHGDEIKNQNDFAQYYDFEGTKMWLTSSFGNGNMKPTQGYMYYNASGDTKPFTYKIVPATTRGNNETAVATHYSVDYTKYPFNMTMVAVVDGAMGDNYEVAALVNGEVRGSARPVYVEALDTYMLFLTISGDEVEEVSFKYYDITTEEEYELVNRIEYSNNAMVGSANVPYVLSRGTTGIGEASMSEVNIYPNPTTTGKEINLQATCDKVEVFNALGVKVAEYQNVDSIDALETAGIYVIRITNNGNVQNCRLVVK